MGILGWAIVGLVAGGIANAVHNDDEPTAVVGTLAVGVLGAIIGGVIAWAAGIGAIGSFFNLGTWLIAVGGAFLLLLLYDALAGDGRTTHSAG